MTPTPARKNRPKGGAKAPTQRGTARKETPRSQNRSRQRPQREPGPPNERRTHRDRSRTQQRKTPAHRERRNARTHQRPARNRPRPSGQRPAPNPPRRPRPARTTATAGGSRKTRPPPERRTGTREGSARLTRASGQQPTKAGATGRQAPAHRHGNRKPTGHRTHRAKAGAGRQAPTPGPREARSGGERGKPRDRDEPGQRAPRTAERQTQGGTAPRRDPTAGRTQRHRNHRNETDTARQSRHNTPPQPENPPRDSPGHQRREPHPPATPTATSDSTATTNGARPKSEACLAPGGGTCDTMRAAAGGCPPLHPDGGDGRDLARLATMPSNRHGGKRIGADSDSAVMSPQI